MTLRLAVSVEGFTEYEFCREVLRSHLVAFDVYVEPKIVVTKLIPYLQVHEFEALLFAAPSVLAACLRSQSIGDAVAAAVDACGGAERVNDEPRTAPAKRLDLLFRDHLSQRYDKPFHGPLLAMEIGLPAIRAACPRFDAWLTQLEQLTS